MFSPSIYKGILAIDNILPKRMVGGRNKSLHACMDAFFLFLRNCLRWDHLWNALWFAKQKAKRLKDPFVARKFMLPKTPICICVVLFGECSVGSEEELMHRGKRRSGSIFVVKWNQIKLKEIK